MKVPIDEVAVSDLEAPVLRAFEAKYRGVVRWFVWRQYCRQWHDHGPVEGARTKKLRPRREAIVGWRQDVQLSAT